MLRLWRLYDGETHLYIAGSKDDVLNLHGKTLGEDPSVFPYLDESLIQIDSDDKDLPEKKKAKDWCRDHPPGLLASTDFHGRGWEGKTRGSRNR